jgi:hypothetical protein
MIGLQFLPNLPNSFEVIGVNLGNGFPRLASEPWCLRLFWCKFPDRGMNG